MSGCVTAVAHVFARCLTSCFSCCRVPRSAHEEAAAAPTKRDLKSSPQPEQRSKEQQEKMELRETEQQESADKNISAVFAQMQRDLAASLENLDAAGR